MNTTETLAHLQSCFEAAYRALGEGAPTLSDDAFVIRTYELARAFGELALATRSLLEECLDPLPILEAVLAQAIAGDETGAMGLYAIVMVVGPRLLVSLRDARDVVDRDDARALIDHARDVIVAQILATGEVAKGRPAIEDASWQAAARDLTIILEESNYAESFGISR